MTVDNLKRLLDHYLNSNNQAAAAEIQSKLDAKAPKPKPKKKSTKKA